MRKSVLKMKTIKKNSLIKLTKGLFSPLICKGLYNKKEEVFIMKKMSKKIIAVCIAIAMMCGLVACGGPDNGDP